MDWLSIILLIIVLILILFLSFSSLAIYYFAENEKLYSSRFDTDKISAIRKVMATADLQRDSVNWYDPYLIFILKFGQFYWSLFKTVFSSVRFFISEFFRNLDIAIDSFKQGIYTFIQMFYDIYILPLVYMIARMVI
jgi:hypothetical protein